MNVFGALTVMLQVTFKIDVTFKIIVELKFNSNLSQIQW
jgi:hypothetical protein